MTTCRLFNYSPNNIYASDYYFACKKFDNIRDKVIRYEHSTPDRESLEYQKMMQEFSYWDNKVPETSNIAGTYEDILKQKEESEINSTQNNKLNSDKDSGHRLDYLA